MHVKKEKLIVTNNTLHKTLKRFKCNFLVLNSGGSPQTSWKKSACQQLFFCAFDIFPGMYTYFKD